MKIDLNDSDFILVYENGDGDILMVKASYLDSSKETTTEPVITILSKEKALEIGCALVNESTKERTIN
jgi:hypothetical protein